MNPYRRWGEPGGRMLNCRLDQLCSSLDDLAARLRAAVAAAVGESLGGLVRDAVLSALARLAGHPPDPEPAPPPARRWYEPGGWEGGDAKRGGPPPWADDGGRDEEPEPYDEPAPASPPPHRLALTASAALQAAAWWLRACPRRRPVLTSVLAALLVGVVAFATPALATAFLGLGGTSGPLRWLAGSLRSGGPLRAAFALS
jgi:hypothetical protein